MTWRAKSIYFIRRADGTGPIKIGCSEFPKLRVKQLEIDYRTKFEVLAFGDGSFCEERNIHLKFAALNERVDCLPARPYAFGGTTEWFTATPELLAFIERVKETGEIPLADNERREVVFAERRRAGDTYQAIGRDYGISRQRVHQIMSGRAA